LSGLSNLSGKFLELGGLKTDKSVHNYIRFIPDCNRLLISDRW
jgi:hypothetical protein